MLLEQPCVVFMQILQLEFTGWTQNMMIWINLGLSLQLLENKIDAYKKLIGYGFDQKKKNSWKIMYLLVIFKVYCES